MTLCRLCSKVLGKGLSHCIGQKLYHGDWIVETALVTIVGKSRIQSGRVCRLCYLLLQKWACASTKVQGIECTVRDLGGVVLPASTPEEIPVNTRVTPVTKRKSMDSTPDAKGRSKLIREGTPQKKVNRIQLDIGRNLLEACGQLKYGIITAGVSVIEVKTSPNSVSLSIENTDISHFVKRTVTGTCHIDLTPDAFINLRVQNKEPSENPESNDEENTEQASTDTQDTTSEDTTVKTQCAAENTNDSTESTQQATSGKKSHTPSEKPRSTPAVDTNKLTEIVPNWSFLISRRNKREEVPEAIEIVPVTQTKNPCPPDLVSPSPWKRRKQSECTDGTEIVPKMSPLISRRNKRKEVPEAIEIVPVTQTENPCSPDLMSSSNRKRKTQSEHTETTDKVLKVLIRNKHNAIEIVQVTQAENPPNLVSPSPRKRRKQSECTDGTEIGPKMSPLISRRNKRKEVSEAIEIVPVTQTENPCSPDLMSSSNRKRKTQSEHTETTDKVLKVLRRNKHNAIEIVQVTQAENLQNLVSPSTRKRRKQSECTDATEIVPKMSPLSSRKTKCKDAPEAIIEIVPVTQTENLCSPDLLNNDKEKADFNPVSLALYRDCLLQKRNEQRSGDVYIKMAEGTCNKDDENSPVVPHLPKPPLRIYEPTSPHLPIGPLSISGSIAQQLPKGRLRISLSYASYLTHLKMSGSTAPHLQKRPLLLPKSFPSHLTPFKISDSKAPQFPKRPLQKSESKSCSCDVLVVEHSSDGTSEDFSLPKKKYVFKNVDFSKPIVDNVNISQEVSPLAKVPHQVFDTKTVSNAVIVSQCKTLLPLSETNSANSFLSEKPISLTRISPYSFTKDKPMSCDVQQKTQFIDTSENILPNTKHVPQGTIIIKPTQNAAGKLQQESIASVVKVIQHAKDDTTNKYKGPPKAVIVRPKIHVGSEKVTTPSAESKKDTSVDLTSDVESEKMTTPSAKSKKDTYVDLTSDNDVPIQTEPQARTLASCPWCTYRGEKKDFHNHFITHYVQ